MSTSFHVHVYFEAEQRSAAVQLREALAARFPHARLGRIHDRAVAFHPAPMYQVTLDRVALGTLIPWLQHHRADLSVLVHPLHGDVVAEHLGDAIWLGRPLKLDEERLRAASSARDVAGTPTGPDRTILRIDASARRSGSSGRQLADYLISRLSQGLGGSQIVRRDLADGVPLLEADMLRAWGVSPEDRSPTEAELARSSDELIAELEAADILVIALPIYNFHVPASFKAWVDLVARARRTFRYTADGPVGLLEDRPVYVIVTSGGTRLNTSLDFVTPWLRHVLGFLGLRDVHLIAADGLASEPEQRLAEAMAEIDQLAP